MLPTETGLKCTLAVELQDSPSVHVHVFLYDFGVMTLERTGLNGGKVSDWLSLCCVTRGWCSIKRAVFDYPTPTT